MAPLARDLAQAYTARCQSKAPELRPLAVQYADYTLWQQQTLGDQSDPQSALGRQLAYWKQTLEALPEQLDLPTDRPRPAIASYRGRRVPLNLSPELHGRLLTLAHQNQSSLFMVLQAALGATEPARRRDRYPYRQPDRRAHDTALDELVGFFVNTLVLRTDTSANPSFRRAPGAGAGSDLGAYAHQDLPLSGWLSSLIRLARCLATPSSKSCWPSRTPQNRLLELPGMLASLEPLIPIRPSLIFCLTWVNGRLRTASQKE